MAEPVLLIGCGRMGGSLLRGWLESGAVDRAIAVEPMPQGIPVGVELAADLGAVPDPLPNTILLAVKPQILDSVLPGLKVRLPASALVISIAAGKPLAYFADRLGTSVATIRTMPNTPAAIGRGISVAVPNGRVSAAQRALCDRLLQAGGPVEWVEDERLIDVVTATSGGGPAYVFLLIEAMAAGGVAAGLPPDLAMKLARTTVSGAGELAVQSPDESAEQLRKNVTSPNGTTQAALAVLMAEGGVTDLMVQAIAAATHRSRELAD